MSKICSILVEIPGSNILPCLYSIPIRNVTSLCIIGYNTERQQYQVMLSSGAYYTITEENYLEILKALEDE